MTESNTVQRKPMHIAVYLGLCFGAWLVGAVVANGISIRMGSVYAEATVPTIVGFWLGKVVLKSKSRGVVGIVAFPVTTFLASIFGSALGSTLASHSPEGTTYTALIVLIIAFATSCGLFALLSHRSNATKRSTL